MAAIGAVVGVIMLGLGYFIVQELLVKSETFDKKMMQIASELNKSCPIMVDQETRLDNAVALPNQVFQYNYTIVNYTKDELNLDHLRQQIEPGLINSVATNPDMKIFRDNQVTLSYSYKDKSGIFLLKLLVTPEMYNGAN